jgi:hypothetical protein
MYDVRRALIAFALVLLAGCGDDTTSATGPGQLREVDGPTVTVGNGTAQTYAMVDGTTPVSLGIALSDGALSSLPDSMAMWQLALPSGVNAGPFDHAELDWNPHGHEPLAIYGVPHFDFHFYTISTASQMTITGGPDTTSVAAQYVPQDYASQVIAVPMMGVHWADTLAAEFHGHAFDKTFIYGFYHGQMAFVEPMVTLAYLQSHPSFTGTVKQPAAFQQPGRYPLTYSVKYDAGASAPVRVSIDSLHAR